MRQNPHHTQKTVSILSDPKLTLQGPPAYLVITKQDLNNDKYAIPQERVVHVHKVHPQVENRGRFSDPEPNKMQTKIMI